MEALSGERQDLRVLGGGVPGAGEGPDAIEGVPAGPCLDYYRWRVGLEALGVSAEAVQWRSHV